MSVEPRIAPKLVELILHISQRCAADPSFGPDKLNKLLYFSDFLAYARFGKPITEEQYVHLSDGPSPRNIVAVQHEMVRLGELERMDASDSIFGSRQSRPVPARAADTSGFASAELALVDEVIESLEMLAARDVGWRATPDGETIPYGTVFLSNEPLSPAERTRGRQLMLELEQSGRLPVPFQHLRRAS